MTAAIAIIGPRRRFVYPILAIFGAFAPDIVSQILILVIVTLPYESPVSIVKFVRYAARPPLNDGGVLTKYAK